MMTTSGGTTVVMEHLRLVLEQFCSPVSEQSWGKLLRSCRLSHRGSGIDCSHFLQVVADMSLKENGSMDKEDQKADAEEGHGKHRLARTVEDYEALLFQKVGENLVSVCRAVRIFDLAHDGLVQESEFRKVTNTFCGHLGANEDIFRKFWRRYDVEDKGLVRYKDLLNKMAANALRYKRSLSNLNMKLALTWPDATENSVKDDRIRRMAILRQEDDPRLKGLTLEEIGKMLREQVDRNYDMLKRVLTVLDERGDGEVTLNEFRSAIVHFTYPISEAMFAQLCRSFNIAVDGAKVHWQIALDKLRCEKDVEDIDNHRPRHRPPIPPCRPTTVVVIDRDIRAILTRADLQPHNALRRLFAVNTKEGPHITRQELRCLLASRGCSMTDLEWRRLAAHLDPGHGNLIAYSSFCSLLSSIRSATVAPCDADGGPVTPGQPLTTTTDAPPRRKSLPPQTLISQLKHRLDRDWSRVEMALCACDPEQKGWINVNRFRRVLHTFCFRLTDQEFSYILHAISSSHGIIERKSFLDTFRLTDRERLVEWSIAVDNSIGHHTVKLSAQRVYSLFQQLLRVDEGPLLAELEKEDLEGKGTIRKFALRNILDRHSCRLADSQFDSLWERLPLDSADVLDYNRMISELQKVDTDCEQPHQSPVPNDRGSMLSARRPATTTSARTLPDSPDPPTPPVQPVPSGNHRCEEVFRAIMTSEWRQIFHQLQRIDVKRRGIVPWQDFQDAMAHRGMVISAEPLMSMLRTNYGIQTGVAVNYVRFLRQFFLQLNKRGSPAARASLHPVASEDGGLHSSIERMRPMVTTCWEKLKREFRKQDSLQRGHLDAITFRNILKSKGIIDSDQTFYHLMDYLDRDTKGQVDYRNFLRLFLKQSWEK